MGERPVTLTTPRIRVVLDSDLDPYVVQARQSDLVAYDVTAYKHKWPPMEKAPFLWLGFLAWSASRRLGLISTDVTYEAWGSLCLEVTAADDGDTAGGAADAVDPTQPAPE